MKAVWNGEGRVRSGLASPFPSVAWIARFEPMSVASSFLVGRVIARDGA